MGDRSTIVIKTEASPLDTITLYGHWAGTDNITAVRTVLSRTDRLGDFSYLTAQLFYEFAVVHGGYDGGLGFGIHTGEDDSNWLDNPTVVVDADTGEYWYDGERFTEFAKLGVHA